MIMTKQIACSASLFLLAFLSGAQGVPMSSEDAPTYSSDGNLITPSHYREWIYLTSGIDMSYEAANATPGNSVFNNFFLIQPPTAASWRLERGRTRPHWYSKGVARKTLFRSTSTGTPRAPS